MKLVKVKLASGSVAWVKAGTQQVDGAWAGLRNAVARGGVQTWRRGLLQRNLRNWQWKKWLGPGAAKFPALGQALQDGRRLLKESGVGDTLLMQAAASRQNGRLQRQRAGRASWAARRAESPPDAGPIVAVPPEAPTAEGGPIEGPLVRRRRLRRVDDL